MYKCEHFKIQELVSKIVYDRFKDFAWSFFDENVLKDLDTIRDYHKMPITINNWHLGGSFSQCGFRSNLEPMVKGKTTLYCSAHCMAKAFDLHSANIRKLYCDIEYLYNNGKLKAIKRIESPRSSKYSWCHVDSFQTNSNKLEYFTA